eukprot:SM000244S08543  [mRNA]  locus=s244:108712:111350:+ [translate_table: standard]
MAGFKAELTAIKPGLTRIGWIGTGVMGQAMCGHLQAAGYDLTIFNRTARKAETLREKGAKLVDSPSAVASESDVVFTIVGSASSPKVVDMTTSQPSLARDIYEAARKRGCSAVDAPVSGGDKGAKSATLAIMAGGDEAVVQTLQPLFNCLGNCTYLGPAGSGQSCKIANQVTIASTMIGMVEGMLYAHKAGLDVPLFVKAISGGAAASKSLDIYASRILQRDFAPGFYVKHFVKDLGIALEECQAMRLALPGLALAQQLYVSLQAHGEGELGTQALLLALERLNHTSIDCK